PQRDHRRVPQRYSKHTAANRQQQTLGQELAYESPSSRAESRADGVLALPHGPARQREVGEIRAADQQHHAYGRKQHVPVGPYLSADKHFRASVHGDAPSLLRAGAIARDAG